MATDDALMDSLALRPETQEDAGRASLVTAGMPETVDATGLLRLLFRQVRRLTVQVRQNSQDIAAIKTKLGL